MTRNTAPRRTSYHVGNLAPRLLAAAREMLEEVGPNKLSLRAVSDRVGVSSTAAYHHFANRAELIGQLAAQGFRELARALIDRDRDCSGTGKLRNASLAYFSFARNNPALYQLMFGPEVSLGEMTPEARKARLEAFGELQRIISEYLQQPVDSKEVRQAALAAWSHSHGLASLVIHNIIQFPADMTDERFVDSSLHGFEYLFHLPVRRSEPR